MIVQRSCGTSVTASRSGFLDVWHLDRLSDLLVGVLAQCNSPEDKVDDSIRCLGGSKQSFLPSSGLKLPPGKFHPGFCVPQTGVNIPFVNPHVLEFTVIYRYISPSEEGLTTGLRDACDRAVRGVGFGHLLVPAFRLISLAPSNAIHRGSKLPPSPGHRLGVPQPRDQAQCIVPIDRSELIALEERGHALGVIGRGPVWEIGAINNLRNWHHLRQR
jgi:hypothetical protein